MKIAGPVISTIFILGSILPSESFAADRSGEPRRYTNAITGEFWYSAAIWGNHGGSSDFIAINYYPISHQFTFFYYFPNHGEPVNQKTHIFVDGKTTVLNPENPVRTPGEYSSWIVSESDEIDINRELVAAMCHGSDIDFTFIMCTEILCVQSTKSEVWLPF